jgi:hypothetical protein
MPYQEWLWNELAKALADLIPQSAIQIWSGATPRSAIIGI